MANRVYLSSTDFLHLPSDAEFDDFSRRSGAEYEAKASVPLFWMCLFTSADIRFVPANAEDDSRAYPYLLCAKEDALRRLHALSVPMAAVMNEERHELYEDWLHRVENEPYSNLLVRTIELDWMCEEGELEADLRQTIKDLDQLRDSATFHLSPAMRNITGLIYGDNLDVYPGPAFAGFFSGAENWPPRLTPPPPAAPPPSRPRWMFWKR
jgi:hypothetical protein